MNSETPMTKPGVIFCYSRDGRGFASRALTAAKVGWLFREYHSSESLRDERDPSPTPRYTVQATDTQWAIITSFFDASNASGVEVYHD